MNARRSPWNSLTWLTMDFRLRALTPIAVALPACVVRKKRGHEVPVRADARIAVLPAAVHGALGAQLHRIGCRHHVPVCPECDGTCLFARLFRPVGRRPSPPITLSLPSLDELPSVVEAGETFALRLTVLGPAEVYCNEVRRALQRAGELGIGEPGLFGMAERQRFEIVDESFAPGRLFEESPPTRARIVWTSPWIRPPVGKEGFVALYVALQSRIVRGLDQIYGQGEWRDHPVPRPLENFVEWKEEKESCREAWSAHYSPYRARRGPEQYLSGPRPAALLQGDLAPFWPLLRLGEAFGVGARTDLGCGRFRLSPLSD